MWILAGLRGERTTVLVTHRLLALEACAVTHVIRGGRIVERGRFDALMPGMASSIGSPIEEHRGSARLRDQQ